MPTSVARWVTPRCQGTKWASARLIKELGGVMMHSVLTGFKTPARAILGTNNIAFTRQMGQLFGAVMEWMLVEFTQASLH